MTSRRPTDPKMIGADVKRFLDGNVPAEVNIPVDKKLATFANKGYAVITIEIRATTDKELNTKLIDNFNVVLTFDKKNDVTAVLQQHLKTFIPQIEKLVEAWLKDKE